MVQKNMKKPRFFIRALEALGIGLTADTPFSLTEFPALAVTSVRLEA